MINEMSNVKVETNPFPSFVCDDVVTSDEIAEILDHWPDQAVMTDEPGMGGTRSWVELIIQDELQDLTKLGPNNFFWENFTKTKLASLIQEIARIFEPYIKSRLSAFDYRECFVGQATLFQANDDFELHGVHTHYSIGPHWIFTGLLQIDDGASNERGSRFYGLDEEPEVVTAKLDVVRNHFPAHKPVIDTGFQPGRLVTFLEGPTSLHGSTPFTPKGNQGCRKIIRFHILSKLEVFRVSYGVEAPSDFTKAVYQLIEDGGAPICDQTAAIMGCLNRDFQLAEQWKGGRGV